VHIIVKEEANLGVSTVASDGRGAEVVRVAETPGLIWSIYSALLALLGTNLVLFEKEKAGWPKQCVSITRLTQGVKSTTREF
jgi:hypothetical protein